MDKQTFYSQLAGKLSELGVGEEYINRHLTQFDGYFSGKSDEEVSQEIAKLGSIDRVAARIKRITDKMIADEVKPEAPVNSETAHQTEPESVRNSTEASRPAAKSETADKAADKESEPLNTPENKNPGQSGSSPCDMTGAPAEDSLRSKMPEPVEHSIGTPDIKNADGQRTVGYALPDEETLQHNRQKFRIIAIATLPLSLAVLLAIAFLFGAAFFGIAVLIIGAVGLLVAMTAAGTLTALFGLIFGVAQMVTSVPIGLYECGLSIIIGSSVLFCGILVYNFAVRLMPYAAKWLLVFAKYVVKKLKELYIYLKKECIGI